MPAAYQILLSFMLNKLLALDSSTEYGSICIYVDGQFHSIHQPMPRKHASDTLPLIEKLLAEAGIGLNDLDGIVFGRGPGSFTGLRIAAGIVQGLALALDRPVYPVSTLTTLAMQLDLAAGNWILPAIDARMNELYWCPHQVNVDGIPEPVAEEQVLPPENVVWQSDFADAKTIGNGWSYQPQMNDPFQTLESSSNLEKYPDARDMIRWVLATQPEGVNSDLVSPVYLRDKVTWDNKPKVGS
jgi:tRNA threonylcarbamoyladenosine biosynthesis protein TsaB